MLSIAALENLCRDHTKREEAIKAGAIEIFTDIINDNKPEYFKACLALANLVAHAPDHCETVQSKGIIKKLIGKINAYIGPDEKSKIVLLLAHLTQSEACGKEISESGGVPIFSAFLNRSREVVAKKCAAALARLSQFPSCRPYIQEAIKAGLFSSWLDDSVKIVNKFISPEANKYIKDAIKFSLEGKAALSFAAHLSPDIGSSTGAAGGGAGKDTSTTPER